MLTGEAGLVQLDMGMTGVNNLTRNVLWRDTHDHTNKKFEAQTNLN